MPELDRKALKEALDVALLDLEAAAAPTKAEVFIRCGTGAGDLRDAIVSLRASLEEAEGRELIWPAWADAIRKKLESYGVSPGGEEGWNIAEDFDGWFDAALQAETERLTARAEAAEQRERRLRAELFRVRAWIEAAARDAELADDTDEKDLADEYLVSIDAALRFKPEPSDV